MSIEVLLLNRSPSRVHLSDATTIIQDELVSCATIEAWEHITHSTRKPRVRPNRRAQRRMKLQEQNDLVKSPANVGATELVFETRGFPWSTIGLLTTCLEQDVEDDFCWVVVDDKCQNTSVDHNILGLM